MALLLSSGFSAVTPGRAPVKLVVPTILSVDNAATTKLLVRLKSVANAKSYEVRATNGPTTPTVSAISTLSRRIMVENLIPGTTYNLTARAIGGSEGFSEWSDPVSHMATGSVSGVMPAVLCLADIIFLPFTRLAGACRKFIHGNARQSSSTSCGESDTLTAI